MGSLDNMLKAANVGSVRSDRDTTSGALRRMKAAAPRNLAKSAGASAPAIGVSAKEETQNVLPLAAPKIEAPAAKAEEPKFLERVWDTVKGTGKQSAGGYGVALNTMYAAGQNARDTQTSTFLADAKRNLETAQRDLAIMERYRKGFAEKEIADQQRMVEDLQKRVDTFGTIGDVQRSATQTANEAVDKLSESGAADIEKAKEDLGTVGRFAVDVGAAGLGMLGDAATGAALGVGALPAMALRGFGSGAAEARQEGAELGDQILYGIGSAATSVATEKLFNMVKPFAKIFGKGATDDLVERAISRAVQRAGKTASGKTAIEGVLRAGTGFVGEGAEEFLESVASPILKRMTYDPDAQFDLEQAIYDFAVGGALGALGGSGEAVTEAQSKYRGYKAQQPGSTDTQTPAAGNLTTGAENASEGLKTPGNDIRPLKTGEEIVAEGQKNSALEAGAVNENGLESLSEQERSNLSSGVKNKVISSFAEAVEFVKAALSNNQNTTRAYAGKITKEVARKVLKETGLDISGYNAIISSDNIRHIIKKHGNAKDEAKQGQVAVTEEDIARIPEILAKPDKVSKSNKKDHRGRQTLLFEKQIGDNYVTVQAVSDGTHSVQTDTLYKQKRKNSHDTEYYNADNVIDPAHNVLNVPPQSSSFIEGAPSFKTESADIDQQGVRDSIPSKSDTTISQGADPVNIGEEAPRYLPAPGMEPESTEGDVRPLAAPDPAAATSEEEQYFAALARDENEAAVPITAQDRAEAAKWARLGKEADAASDGSTEAVSAEDVQELGELFAKAKKTDAKDPALTEELSIDKLPRKAKEGLEKLERKLVNRLGSALSVPYHAKRDYLQPMAREISEEYIRTGRVSSESVDALFERAYNEGVMQDRAFYDQYRDLKKQLLNTPLTVSEQLRTGVDNFEDFRKKSFGTLKIVKENGLPVDVAYETMSGYAPELFPADITNPADQLQRLYEVGKSISITKRKLQEYYGAEAETFKAWEKAAFEKEISESIANMRNIRRYAEERVAKKARSLLSSPETIKEAFAHVRNARKAAEKASAKNFLTDYDNMMVGKLLRGEIELEEIDPERGNVKGIEEVYRAKEEYEKHARVIREYNRQRKAKLHDEAKKLVETANSWKDKAAGILYSRETMERNIRDIVPDKTLAGEIIEKYFKPVHDAEAASNRFKNSMRERVKALNLSRDVAEGNEISEAHAVQLLGEALYNAQILVEQKNKKAMRDGKTLEDWNGIIDDVYVKNPNMDMKKVEDAISSFHTIYDELFTQMNEVYMRNGYEPVAYRRGYFPHFMSSEEGGGLLEQVSRTLGIQTEVTALPTTINGLTHTFKPGVRWFGNAKERKGVNTTYDAVEGFDRYIEGVSDVIHQTDNIQRLRAMASELRYMTSNEGIREQVDAIMEREDLDEQDKKNRVKEVYEKGEYTLSNFVVELEEYTNLLAGKKSRHDRSAESDIGRRLYNLGKWFESRVAANMVAVNPASWLTNFIPITQGAAMLDSGTLLRAMKDTLRAYQYGDDFVDRSTFLTNRRGSERLVQTKAQKLSEKLSKGMEYIDQFTADTLVRARYAQNLAQGLSKPEAMDEADSWAASVMADRSKGAMPTLFNRQNPGTKLFTQFQLEVNNQMSYLFKDMPAEAGEEGKELLAKMLLKFCLGAYLYNEVYEYFIGRRPALDPIGILNETAGDLTGYELPNVVDIGTGIVGGEMPKFKNESQGAYKAVTGLGANIAENVPFIGGMLGGGRLPISSALPDVENLGKALLSDDWDAMKKRETIAKELATPALYLIPPYGGGQLKKAIEGMKAVVKGGSYTVNSAGEDILQYPVYTDTVGETALNAGRAMVFGKTSLPTGKDWVESGFDSFSVKETSTYQGMNEAGVSDREAHALIEQLRTAKKTGDKSAEAVKRDMLRAATITPEGKAAAYYGLLANEDERGLMLSLSNAEDIGRVTECLMNLRDAEDTEAEKVAILRSGLSERAKQRLYTEYVSDKKSDVIRDVLDAGVSFNDWLGFETKTAGLKSDDENTKKEKVLSVIDGMNLSAKQKDALYFAAGYKEKTLDEAPWYQSEYQKYSLKVPELQLPELKLPDLPPLYLAAP